MTRTRAALALVAALAAGVLLVSGGSSSDPRTPAALPGLPPPFLGVAVLGDGGATAAVDAYGDVADLRPAPAGPALIENPAGRQAAGTVAAATGIVPRLRRGGAALPPWRAEAISQRYLPGTNVLVTTARFGRARLRVTAAASGERLALAIRAEGAGAQPAVSVDVAGAGRCRRSRSGSGALELICTTTGQGTATGRAEAGEGAATGRAEASDPARARAGAGRARRGSGAVATIAGAARGDRRWLARSRPLGSAAPAWARRLYARSLLTLRALAAADGAVAAGARDGWAYVWPRDAATAAIALAAAGHGAEARRVSGFLGHLDLSAAARFRSDGSPVPGRAAQGDAAGWLAVARKATKQNAAASALAQWGAVAGSGRIRGAAGRHPDATGWRQRSDYQEKAPGDYLGNAIAASAARGASVAAIARLFAAPAGLSRRAGDPASGVDSAAAWAVRPFPLPSLFAAARRSLRQLLTRGGRFGIVPSAGWPEADPWTAPTAWSAWAFAALGRADGADSRPNRAGHRADGTARRARAAADSLAAGDRRAARTLLADLRRAATPLDTLPERLDARTGVPRSTTPLAWSHAFAILALRELWPGPGD